jgi:hypothetical protein
MLSTAGGLTSALGVRGGLRRAARDVLRPQDQHRRGKNVDVGHFDGRRPGACLHVRRGDRVGVRDDVGLGLFDRGLDLLDGGAQRGIRGAAAAEQVDHVDGKVHPHQGADRLDRLRGTSDTDRHRQGRGGGTGAITRYAASLDESGGIYVALAGWIQPCAELGLSSLFAVMRYHDRGALPVERLPGTTFDSTYYVSPDPHFGQLRALCIALGYNTPLACVGIERPVAGAAPVLTSISTTDTRVTRPPVISPMPPPDHPVCGNCV